MAHDIFAEARFIPHSAQKVRLVVDMVRGKDVVEALNISEICTQRCSSPGCEGTQLSHGQWRGKLWCQP